MSPRVKERLWICEHYRVLPTDERFQRLTDIQVGTLFYNWLYSPSEADVKQKFWEWKAAQNPPPDTRQLEELGYSPAEIEQIIKELA